MAAYEPGNQRYVGLAGQEIAGAGRDMVDASNIVAQTNERQDAIVAQAGVNQLAQARMTAEFDPQQGFRNVHGGNAVGQPFIDTYGQKFNDASAKLRAGLQNDNQRRIFDQHAETQGLQFRSALLQHQSQETEKFNDQTADNTINLSLRTMGQNPTNELTFQTELARINGTVDSLARRKGLPDQTASEVKAKYLDAAYTTRILSVMQGVPGAVQANPYTAEKMFEQVRDQLGPVSQVHLGHEVQKAVQGVQARDTAQAFVFGKGTTQPSNLAPAVTGGPLQSVVEGQESGGQRYDVSGNLLTSPKGAQGEMQVMPATAANPGYGVTPARDNSPGELARVGRDYLGAMTARYDEPALVLAAYNAGPGQVDKWIGKYGDPRSGQISPQDWAAKIPFAETQSYVVNGLKKLGENAGQPSAPSTPPTAHQLKTDLYARVQAARQVAEQQYPGDTAYADGVAARVESYGRQVLANQSAVESSARDTLLTGVLGNSPDGSDKPKSIDALLADPQMKAAWSQATPETKLALQQRMAKGDKAFTEESFNTYYQLKGMAANDPESFMKVDLGKSFGEMPDHALHELVQQQSSISVKDAKSAARDLNWSRAKSSVEDMLKPIGLGISAKASTAKAKDTEVFYGKLNDAMQQYHDQNNKWPDTQTTRGMAAGLLSEGKTRGSLGIQLLDSSTRAFQAEDQSKFYIPLPSASSADRAGLLQDFQRKFGRAPASDAELQSEVTKQVLASGNKPRWMK